MLRFFAEHPTAANLLMIFLLAIGVVSLPGLKRATFPDFAADAVETRIIYPGADAQTVEEALCQRLEDAVDGVENIEETRCEAREGIAINVVEMREGGDYNRFVDDIQTEIEAIDDFPDRIETPTIKPLGRTDHVASIAVTGPMSVVDLKAYAEQLKDRLKQTTGVSLIDIRGFSEHQLRIEIDPLTLRQYGLSVADIADAINRQSLDLPAGAIQGQQGEVLLRFNDERHSPREFEELIVIGGSDGAQIRLGDIARIEDRFELDEEKILFNGERAALLNISKTRDEDVLDVFAEVEQFVKDTQVSAPPGVRLVITNDLASLVQDRLLLLVDNAWQGLILVALSLWLFFSARFSFWVVMGLPVSFLGSICLMNLFGYSLNMLTMVGLLIAIGLLMDDAIVIAENIASHVHKGKSALQAAIDGTAEVSHGVIAAFITTVCVFTPLAFLEGDIGKVLRVMPVVLIMTLAVSLIEAFWLLPRHMVHALETPDRDSRFRQGFEARFIWVRDNVVGVWAEWVIRWRYFFIGAVFGIFFLSIGMLAGGVLKFSAFPELDGDILEARILLPQGTPLTRTEAVVKRVTDALEVVNAEFTPRQPNQQSLVRNVRVQFNFNADAQETGAHVATVSVDLLSAEIRNARISDIRQQWRDKLGALPDVLNLNIKEPALGPAGLPIEIRLSGQELAQLDAASRELQAWLNNYRGVLDLMGDLRPGKPEIRLKLREGALSLGLNASTVARQLRAAYQGQIAQEIQVGVESYEIDVRFNEANRDSIADLEYFTLTAANGKQVPLGSIADIVQERGYARINRVNGLRTVTIQGDIDTQVLNVAELFGEMRTTLLPDLRQRYPGVKVSFEGEVKQSQTTANSIQRGFMLGLLGVFIVLSFQFRGYLAPLMVMSAIPLALIGVIWGHLLMGLDLTMPSMVGFVSLAGIVVNDSILLVSFLRQNVAQGMAIHDAAVAATRARFRPVLLTSLTTIAGLLPLLSETSFQAQVLIPLVTSLVFGLLASTVLILLVIPALYTILEDVTVTPTVTPTAASEKTADVITT